uniref:EF-hand domain-containing protein n=1 Tax=Salvator merianae TaxID=96440 RepID=A0A8D0BSQ6_SALMN
YFLSNFTLSKMQKKKKKKKKEMMFLLSLPLPLTSFLLCTEMKYSCISVFFQKVAMRDLVFDVKKADILKLLKDYDWEGTGKITFEDFNEGWTGFLAKIPTKRYSKAFGKVDLSNFYHRAKFWAMTEEFDKDGDGESKS